MALEREVEVDLKLRSAAGPGSMQPESQGGEPVPGTFRKPTAGLYPINTDQPFLLSKAQMYAQGIWYGVWSPNTTSESDGKLGGRNMRCDTV